MILRGVLLITLVISSGCATLESFRGTKNKLIGTWQYKEKKMGPMILTFKKDAQYEVDYNGDGIKDIWGQYSMLGHRVTFRDKGGEIGPLCHEAGVYYYSVKGSDLSFLSYVDQCKPRFQALSVFWERIK